MQVCLQVCLQEVTKNFIRITLPIGLYHRDYQEREPVEITIEPDRISILSYAGPDRSISLETINKAERLKSRRYRNRRLGDYLKELQLSEGRATGIPTIQDELRKNGSSLARIETDELRTYFLIEIPCREGFEVALDLNEAINEAINEEDRALIKIILDKPGIKKLKLSELLNISIRTISRILKKLSTEPLDFIEYQGSKKTGGYFLTDKGKVFIEQIDLQVEEDLV